MLFVVTACAAPLVADGSRPVSFVRWATERPGPATSRAEPSPASGGQNGAVPDLRCLSRERISCGCSLALVDTPCQDDRAGAHFHSDLHQGAPLWLNLAGRETSLPSRLPVTNVFWHGGGDRWEEEYDGGGVNVRIRYRPAASTCPAEKRDDGCEYFDVAADVVVRLKDGAPTTLRAAGTCGC